MPISQMLSFSTDSKSLHIGNKKSKTYIISSCLRFLYDLIYIFINSHDFGWIFCYFRNDNKISKIVLFKTNSPNRQNKLC